MISELDERRGRVLLAGIMKGGNLDIMALMEEGRWKKEE